MTAPTGHRPLLTEIELRHGPRALLGRFFLKASEATHQRGVTISVGTFHDLVEVNRQNRATWQPLDTTYQPELSQIDETTSICLLGHNSQGDVVATQGLRLFDWTGTNMKAEAESLRLFYADPTGHAAPGERCEVSAAGALGISSRVAYGGAIWYRPDYRAGRLSTVLPRIGRAMAFSEWGIENVFALMTESNIKAGFPQRIGYTKVELGVIRYNAPITRGTSDIMRLGLASMTAEDLIDDVFSYLLEVEPEVYSGVKVGNA